MRAGLLGVLGVFVIVAACGSSNDQFGKDAGGKDGSGPGFDGGFGPLDGSTSDSGPPVDKCHVPPDNSGDNAPVCTQPPQPPNSFDPVIKWSWDDPGNGGFFKGSMVTPLVANFTDDNADGEVNLCDIPDVIVATEGGPIGAQGTIYMLAGDTGKLEYTFDLA